MQRNALENDPDLKALEDFWWAVADECARRPFSLRMLAQARLVRLSSRSMQAMYNAVSMATIFSDLTTSLERIERASRLALAMLRLLGRVDGQ